MAYSISVIVSETWERVLRETPDPMRDALEWNLFSPQTTTYRERLDRRKVNTFGEVIPRITIVRNNLRKLDKPKHAPRLPA